LADKPEYGIVYFSDLDGFLGEKWHIRICNIGGDFSTLVLMSVKFYATQPMAIMDFSITDHFSPITDHFSPITDEPQHTELVPYFIQPPPAIVFRGEKATIIKGAFGASE